jgi:hypothetical protein
MTTGGSRLSAVQVDGAQLFCYFPGRKRRIWERRMMMMMMIAFGGEGDLRLRIRIGTGIWEEARHWRNETITTHILSFTRS